MNIFLLILLILPAVAAPFGYWLGNIKESYRNILHIAVYVMGFIIVSWLYIPVSQGNISIYIPHIMGTGLLLKLDMLRYIFLWTTAIIWPLAMIYSTRYLIRYLNRNRYYLFFLLTYFSTMGLFLSENILNLFAFFEMMSILSYFLIIQDEDEYAHRAGASYLGAAIAGGLFLLLGILLAYNYAETLVISDMDLLGASQITRIAIGVLILIGFGIKACIYPLHFWLPKTYTAAPMPATIILSAVLAKIGIFGILITLHYLLRGEPVLALTIVILGMTTIILGGILALVQRNMKRTLAYSSMSQMGYILLAVALIDILGSHGQVAIYGALFHVINHALIKALLFIMIGVIYMAGREYSINAIYGIARHSRILKCFFMLGVLNLIGMPGTSGYISKTLIHEALIEASERLPNYMYDILNVCFYIGGALTFAYIVKLFIAIFIEGNNDYPKRKFSVMEWPVLLPVTILSAIILFLGICPDVLYSILSQAASTLGLGGNIEPHLYTGVALISAIKTIFLGIILYLCAVHFYLRKETDGYVQYKNPLSNAFKLEEDLIIPFFSWLFKNGLIVFGALDQVLTRLYIIIIKYLRLVKSIFDLNLKKAKDKSEEYEVNDIMDHLVRIYSSLESDGDVNVRGSKKKDVKRNTMSYSAFIFGAIFVLSLLFIFLRSTILH